MTRPSVAVLAIVAWSAAGVPAASAAPREIAQPSPSTATSAAPGKAPALPNTAVTNAPAAVPGVPLPESFASSADAVSFARKRVADGDLNGAIAALERNTASDSGTAAARRYLGDLYYRKGDFAAAERTYLAIIRADYRDREAYNRLGGVYAAEDRISDAIAAFTKSLPNDQAYGELAFLHRRAGDLADFAARLRNDAEQDPDDAEKQFAIGVVDRIDHKYAESTVYLEKAVALQPYSCSALTELASTYLDSQRQHDALGVLQRCLNRDAENYPALVNLGVAYTQTNDAPRARDAFEHANRVRPEGAEALVDLGFVADMDGRWQTAVQFYLRALGCDPLQRDAYLDLGFDYNQHKLYPLAEAAYLKGLSAAPDDGRLHYLLGVTYADQGKTSLARSEYERAERSNDPEAVRAAEHDLAQFDKS